MATTKHQLVRYNKLNECFQNYGKEYTIDNLLEEVNKTILEYATETSGIQIRTLRKDISFMKSASGYNAPIEVQKGSNGVNYYRYEDKTFSISKSPLNYTEAEQLKQAISILQRFGGSPEFEWINEIAPLLNDKFNLKNEQKVISLESNIDYTGYEYITPIFNAIINKTVLKIIYEPFNQKEYEIIFHPYYLKQYNNRWFVRGFNEYNNHSKYNLALDRIKQKIETSSNMYKNDNTDWEDYFDDLIGVSRGDDDKLEEVKLIFTKSQAPYILTKPLHNTQKSRTLENETLEVRIKVIINYELEMKILSFGEKVTVISPDSLVCKIKERIKKQFENY